MIKLLAFCYGGMWRISLYYKAYGSFSVQMNFSIPAAHFCSPEYTSLCAALILVMYVLPLAQTKASAYIALLVRGVYMYSLITFHFVS